MREFLYPPFLFRKFCKKSFLYLNPCFLANLVNNLLDSLPNCVALFFLNAILSGKPNVIPVCLQIYFFIWFMVKTIGVVFVLEYIGNVAARLRIDQVVHGNWKLLIPLSVLSLALIVIIEPILIEIVIPNR